MLQLLWSSSLISFVICSSLVSLCGLSIRMPFWNVHLGMPEILLIALQLPAVLASQTLEHADMVY